MFNFQKEFRKPMGIIVLSSSRGRTLGFHRSISLRLRSFQSPTKTSSALIFLLYIPPHTYIYITPSRSSSSSSGNPSSWPWKVRKAVMAASIAFNPTATIAPVSSAKKKIAPLRFYSPVSATSRSLLIRSSPFPKSRSERSSAFPGKKRS